MTLTTGAGKPAATAAPTPTKRGHWIDDWRPEDPAFWESTGKKVAKRNLLFSIFSEHIGFSVWVLWSVFVLFLPGGQYGISTDALTAAGQKFLLTSLPAGLGSAVRLPYTLAVAKFGGRNWTVVSALMLLLPTVTTAMLLTPDASFSTLMVLAALTGVGGGNFASSMTNINSFYPQHLKGWALGLNAGGGNLGVALVQLVGLGVLATAGATHPRVMLGIYIPLIVIAALGSYFTMDNLSQAKNEKRALRDVCTDPNTWVMSFLYIGTFGSFIGFGFAFGQVLTTQFPTHFFGLTNLLSNVKATHTPVSDWLFHTTWFKNPQGSMLWDITDKMHPHAISAHSVDGWKQSVTKVPSTWHLTGLPVIDPTTGKQATAGIITYTDPANAHHVVKVLSAKLDPTTYNTITDPKALANAKPLAVHIGHKVDPKKVALLTFLGPLIGSLIRPIGGLLADKIGGAKTTFVNFIAMTASAVTVLIASQQKSLGLFMVGFIALFIFSGVGNGSTYKMIPSIFRSKAQLDVANGKDPETANHDSRRLSGALIGVAGAIGAFGGVLVNIAFRQSFLSSGNGNAAYIGFIAFYVACVALTWFVYLRKSPKRLEGV